MYRDAGDLARAEQAYLGSLDIAYVASPKAKMWYRLAGIYDERGDSEKARDAWQRVVIAFENGDPEVQPMVEEARARLEALR